MYITLIFWKILGFGLAVPCTFICIVNVITSATHADSYKLQVNKLAIFYIVALLGWAMALGIQ